MQKIKKYQINTLIFIIPFLMGIGVDLHVPSLPKISEYFATNATSIQLTISFYMLGYGLGPIFFGVLSDSIGLRKIILTCTFFYTIISLLCVASINPTMLIAMRFLQGLCIAGLATMIRAIATDTFSGIELKKAMSYIVIFWTLGPILGPFIGSYLQYSFNWHANFYLLAIYGLFVLSYSLLLLPETNNKRLPLSLHNAYNRIKVVAINQKFIYPAIFAALIYSEMVMFNIIGPFLIENIFHYSVITYGYIALSVGLAAFTGNLCNRLAIQYYTSMRIIGLSILFSFAISIIMLLYGLIVGTSSNVVIVSVLLITFCFGFGMPSLMSNCMSPFTHVAGTASALFTTGLGIGVVVMTSFAALVKISSPIPMEIIYVSILTACTILFIIYNRVYCTMNSEVINNIYYEAK